MKWLPRILIVVMLLLSAAAIWFSGQRAAERESVEDVAVEKEAAPASAPPAADEAESHEGHGHAAAAPGAEPEAEAAPEEDPNRVRYSGPLDPPALEAVRAEVARDPHGTPPTLLAFASRMADRMEVALASEAEATRFFGELDDCVQDQSPATGLPQTRLSCLANAGRLSRKYPGALSGKFGELEDKVPGLAATLRSAGLDKMK